MGWSAFGVLRQAWSLTAISSATRRCKRWHPTIIAAAVSSWFGGVVRARLAFDGVGQAPRRLLALGPASESIGIGMESGARGLLVWEYSKLPDTSFATP